MSTHHTFLCLIPARGGSKRLPGKNIMDLHGKPLLAYAVEGALESDAFDRVMVSTEDEAIAEVGRKYGAAIRNRPEEYASDTASSLSVVLDALDSEEAEGRTYDFICELPPTAPLRTAEDIRQAAARLVASDAHFMVGVVQAEPPPHIALTLADDGEVAPLFNADYFKLRRQDMPVSYYPNGSIYMARVSTLRKGLDFYEAETLGYPMPAERSVNIDTAMDFTMAQVMMDK